MKNPALYQINTRVVLQERGKALGRPATLDDLDDRYLDSIAMMGFQWVWFLGIWQTGAAGRAVSRSDPKTIAECRRILPDLREDDITGSPFSIVAYKPHADFGGDGALTRLRGRLSRRNLKLLLDFVPNHTAPDHPWVTEHPEYYIHGSEFDLSLQPQNYTRARTGRGQEILAYGRDPYFDGWSDTLQLNYMHAGFREARIAELGSIADRCDGVRCDMAMLLQPEIIRKTWGDRARPSDGSLPRESPFWPEAIAAVRRRHPQFLFIAEVYWDMEWELQQAGFDYTYDKRLYDRLVGQQATPVRQHLWADPSFQDHSLRFIENHDEPRAAEAFPPPQHKAAAVLGLLSRGMRLIHEGQMDGRKVHVSMHLGRRPVEPVDEDLRAFYTRFLRCLAHTEAHEGEWTLWPSRSAWPGNESYQQIMVASWHSGDRRMVYAVNYGPTQAQGYVTLGLPGLSGRPFMLADMLSDVSYQRHGDGLAGNGLYLDMPPWGHHAFDLRPT